MSEIKRSVFGKSPAELKAYTDSLIKGDRNKCLKYLEDYLNHNPNYIQLYEEVLKKSLYEVGEMWEYNRISVASEHLATSITELLLNSIYEEIVSPVKAGKKIVLACTEKEQHRVGIRMVADLFEKNGWETFFLGADVPAIELVAFIRDVMPDLLALSLSVYYNLPNLEKMLGIVRSEFAEIPVIIGGQAFRFGGKEILSKFNNIIFIDDLYSLDMYIKNRI